MILEKNQPAPAQQLSVELDPDVAHGTYTNLALITHSPSEFVVDFARMMPGLPKAKIHARMIMTPQNAKGLLKTLEANIRRYEESHGEIKLPGLPGKDLGFHSTDSRN
jgi:hypothetical protein